MSYYCRVCDESIQTKPKHCDLTFRENGKVIQNFFTIKKPHKLRKIISKDVTT